MFRDKDKNLQRLEKELLSEEKENDGLLWDEENDAPEDFEDDFTDEDLREDEPPAARPAGKRRMSRLMKLSITALCLLGGIALVLLYWLVRFF